MIQWDNSKVTVELGALVESGIDIWAFQYPSYYKGDDKKAFEQKVIDHYRFRQIGQETPARFLHYFRTRMREIMPYYIQLYESEALMQSLEDPFGNVDITETYREDYDGTRTDDFTVTSTGGTKDEKSGTDKHKTLDEHEKRFSNTPQGSIANLDDHLTEATVDSNDSDLTVTYGSVDEHTIDTSTTNGGTSGNKGFVERTMTKKGNQGVNTYAHDMLELRKTFLNIDMQIIKELNDLFLMVY